MCYLQKKLTNEDYKMNAEISEEINIGEIINTWRYFSNFCLVEASNEEMSKIYEEHVATTFGNDLSSTGDEYSLPISLGLSLAKL